MVRRSFAGFLTVIAFLLFIFMSGGSSIHAASAAETCDRGAEYNAMGHIVHGLYVVAPHDTLYSIAERYCTTVYLLQSANGMAHHDDAIYVGQRLVIPYHDSRPDCTNQSTVVIEAPAANARVPASFQVTGRASVQQNQGRITVFAYDNNNGLVGQATGSLNPSQAGSCPGAFLFTFNLTLTPESRAAGMSGYLVADAGGVRSASVPIVYGAVVCPNPFLTIDSPVNGQSLPSAFTVTGRGCLNGASPEVRVQALDAYGTVLNEQTAQLQNQRFNVALTVRSQTAQGRIIVADSSGQFPVRPEVFVSFATSGSTGTYTALQNCRLFLFSGENTPLYLYPGDNRVGQTVERAYDVIARVELSGAVWYMIQMPPPAYNVLWIPISGLNRDPIVCT